MKRTIVSASVIMLALAACNERRPTPSGAAGGASQESAGGSSAAKEASTRQKEETARGEAERLDGAFPSQVAGGFYPEDPAELLRSVRGFIDGASKKELLSGRDIVGVLSPHAGYQYSGPVAGAAYASVEGRDIARSS